KQVDSGPGDIPPSYAITEVLDGFRIASTETGTPSDLGVIEWKRGALASTDCSDLQGYRLLISIPQTIRTSDLPARVCWRLSDKAGNFAPPVVFDFGPPTIQPSGVRNSASYERGVISPGALIRVDTLFLTNTTEFSGVPVESLAGVSATLLDSAGHTSPVLLTVAGPLSLEGVVPLSAIPGPATLQVRTPAGSVLSQSVQVLSAAPGTFSADFT